VDDRLRDDYFARVCNAVEYADGHLDEDLTLPRLAAVACFSHRHFHRVFTSLLGETPDDCVRRLRLEKAASLALMPDPPSMTEIALECGFSTPALFSRNFAKAFGASPTEWRAGMKRQEKVKHRQALVPSGKDPRTSFRYLLGEDEKTVDVDVVALAARRAWCVPYLQGYNEGVSEAFTRLLRWARPRGLLSGEPKVVAIPFDNPEVTPPQRCRNYAGIIPDIEYEGGAEATAAALGPGGGKSGLVRVVELPGGSYLRASHAGGDWNLHGLYRLIYEVVAPQLGFASFGGKSFIEYPDRAKDLAGGPRAWIGSLVHVPVRPGGSP
jgi:AraC family transcriptional regulator